MYHPLQCLLHCAQSPNTHFLVAAAGSLIHTFSVRNGMHVCTWPSSKAECDRSDDDALNSEAKNDAANPDESPAKRPKLTPAISPSSSTEIVLDRQDQDLGSNPWIIKFAASRNGKHVIAITGEDKCVHVFELSSGGVLTLFSERTMPKRPCALAITPDDSTILCADKFGDVYALPLLGKTYEVPEPATNGSNAAIGQDMGIEAEPFVPKATTLTVHTKRNRNALKQQQKLKIRKPQKKHVSFDHKLILGHVSLLTDVAHTSLPCEGRQPREYLVTCDRDEHIRISRGLPQAHVIEGFCLGHSSFVSKLCFLPSHPRLLISGGGDNQLFLWDWPSGQVKQRIELKERVNAFKRSRSKAAAKGDATGLEADGGGSFVSIEHIAVNNVVFLLPSDDNDQAPGQLFAAVEGVPAIFIYELTSEFHFEFVRWHATEGNVIDIIQLPDFGAIIYSMDSGSQAGRDYIGAMCVNAEVETSRKQYQFVENVVATAQATAREQPFLERKNAPKGKSLGDLLYGLESLRKRDNDDVNGD